MTIMNMVGGGGAKEHGYAMVNGIFDYKIPMMCVQLTGTFSTTTAADFYVGGPSVGPYTQVNCVFKAPVIEGDWVGFSTEGTMRKVLISTQYYRNNRGVIDSITGVSPVIFRPNTSSTASNPMNWGLSYAKYKISGKWVFASAYAKERNESYVNNMPYQLTADGKALETFQGTLTYDGTDYSFTGEYPRYIFKDSTNTAAKTAYIVPVDCEITELE